MDILLYIVILIVGFFFGRHIEAARWRMSARRLRPIKSFGVFFQAMDYEEMKYIKKLMNKDIREFVENRNVDNE